jgi:hypothetical protein
VLLAFALLIGFAGTAGIVMGMIATNTLWGPWSWQTLWRLALNLLIGAGAIWGLVRLKPWRSWGEPVNFTVLALSIGLVGFAAWRWSRRG